MPAIAALGVVGLGSAGSAAGTAELGVVALAAGESVVVGCVFVGRWVAA